jgi:threonine/homoserine/homoserine lactone efflux protein
VWAALASLGLAAVLAASPVAYEIVTVAGALYLVWMGVSGLLAARRAAAPAPAPDQPASQEPALDHRGPARSYLIGAVTNLLNPKVGIFFMSFLPGFVPAGKPVGAVSVLLGALFVAETAIWLGFVLVAAATISGWLRRPAVRKRFEQITSLVLVGFGIRVILSQ